MTPRIRRGRVPPEMEDRLHVAAIVAAQRAMDEHVRSAVELVEEGADRAPIERLLAAYGRLHHMDGKESRQLRERALATLGRSATELGSLSGPRSLFARARRRLRGRTNPELRSWVERHTARAELAVLDIHVEKALEMVRLAEEHVAPKDAVALYAEMLALRPAVAEMVELRVLKALYERESGHVEPLRADGATPIGLRMADNQR